MCGVWKIIDIPIVVNFIIFSKNGLPSVIVLLDFFAVDKIIKLNIKFNIKYFLASFFNSDVWIPINLKFLQFI